MTDNMVTIKGENGEFGLEEWQVEAAYRHQLHKYTVMDAKKNVSAYLDLPLLEPTEEDYENLADEFLSQYDCDTDENSQWEQVITDYFEMY